MKKLMLSFATMVLVMGTFVACGNHAENDTEQESELQLLSEDELEGVTFKRGDVFADMSVTTPDGTTYKISEILKEKKAVVLNFWYINCGPCQMEFPYMQDAYETYQEDIEILAVNPYDGTDETVAEFQKKFELTFPMAAIDEEWAQYMELQAYPTTVVIDRYGIVSYKHTGMITEVEEFNKLFGFFTADDYEQTVIRNISDIE
ncbi:MAG: TlpA family protein disulfide reductase [Agathobacter sp.]|nr:TlpA family protein disulfide reductase [Agathobacter sp.]